MTVQVSGCMNHGDHDSLRNNANGNVEEGIGTVGGRVKANDNYLSCATHCSSARGMFFKNV